MQLQWLPRLNVQWGTVVHSGDGLEYVGYDRFGNIKAHVGSLAEDKWIIHQLPFLPWETYEMRDARLGRPTKEAVMLLAEELLDTPASKEGTHAHSD